MKTLINTKPEKHILITTATNPDIAIKLKELSLQLINKNKEAYKELAYR